MRFRPGSALLSEANKTQPAVQLRLAGDAEDNPGAATLRMVASTKAVRYFHIALWAVFLATVVPLNTVAVWFFLTMFAGFGRGLVETRLRKTAGAETPQRLYAFIAMTSCAFWAAAPLLAWQADHPYGRAAAVFLVIVGFMLVLSQFRSTPTNAVIVTAPYSAVYLWMLADSLGEPILPIIAVGGAIGIATVAYYLIFGYVLQKDIQRAGSERVRLIKELENSRIAAERASEAKSMFLANMSHEIRTPMNGVLGMAELLANTHLDSRQRLYADTIHKSGAALLTIINDILDFSKIEAGKLELDIAPFDLRAAIEDVAALIAPGAHEKQLEVVVRFQPGLSPEFMGDAGRLRQIITNLAGNAVKFTNAGYVLLNVSGAEKDGTASIRVEVSDTGVGIPKEKALRIFDAFQQADTSTTRQFGGTGLGLSISKRLVEAMGGEIGLQSELGEGSTFWFEVTLPVSSSGSVTETPSRVLYGKRVLIVDDIDVNRQITSEQLEAWGFLPQTASDGEAALSALRAAQLEGRPFDLAILDYFMPTMDGEMLAREIRNDPDISETPILVMSSVDQAGGASLFRALGVEGYLVKPVRSTFLMQTIAGIFSKASPREDERSKEQKIDAEAPVVFSGDRLRILLAEDNEVNQLVLRHMLDPAAHELTVADNGRQALDLFQKNRGGFDLILMDVSMPEMDGYEATRAIRAVELEKEWKRVPIVCLTAHVMSSDVEQSERAGMNDFLAKPVSKTKLDAVLERWTAQIEWDEAISA